MPRTPIHEMPIKNGGTSVLSGKDTIKGMPKSPAARRKPSEPEHCDSVLDGPECIGGTDPKRDRAGSRQ